MNRETYAAVAFISAATAKGFKSAGDQFYSASDIKSEATRVLATGWGGVTSDLVDRIAKSLVAEGFLEELHTPHASVRYKFNMLHDERYLPDFKESDNDLQATLRLHSSLGDNWLKESFETVLSQERTRDADADADADDAASGIHVETPAAPASDRYVALDDNQRKPALEELGELRRAVEQSNEGSAEERTIALSEVAAFEAALVQPRIATELIERFVTRILKWIASKFSEALVTTVVAALINKLLPLLSAG